MLARKLSKTCPKGLPDIFSCFKFFKFLVIKKVKCLKNESQDGKSGIFL